MILLFDIDDTLMDHSTAVRAATDTLHRDLGVAGSEDDFYRTWTAAIRRHFDRFVAGEVSYEEQRRARVRESIDPTLPDEAADRIFASYLSSYESHWTLFPDVRSCLERLSGYRLGVISNGGGIQQRRKLERTGIAHWFDCVVIAEEFGSAKPHPQIFHHACSTLGHPPRRAVYVGDLYDVDAAASRRAGLTGVWLDRQGKATIDQSPPIIRSLDSLEEAVEASVPLTPI